jgi:microcystin-dependent protein
MSNPFLGEIRAFGFNFAPYGWAMCNGQILSISQNTALFSLIGTYYGGNGTSNFALPNLQGSVAIGQGQGAGLSAYAVGDTGGLDAVTLLESTIPSHSHLPVAVASQGTSAVPTSNLWAESWVARSGLESYSDVTTAPVSLSDQALGFSGGTQPHENRPPLLVVNFCIAMQGIFPSRN